MQSNSKKFNIQYTAKLASVSADNDIRIWLVQPSDLVCQKIEDFSISQEPKNTYIDKQGNKILFFQFQNEKKIEIKINIKAALAKQKIDLEKTKLVLPKNHPEIIKQYTKNEVFLEQGTELKKITRQITKKDNSVLEQSQSIFNFVIQNFQYCYPVKNRGVKNLDLNKLKGDCGEYSSLFVTMCRILNIPARNNTGFVLLTKPKKILEHGWASIYLKPYGWLDIDTQYASLEKNINLGFQKYFLQRDDYRLVFTKGFNIPLKPAIPKSFKLDYWNDLGLPLKNNSVQTLQPIVFASKEKVKFKETMKLV